MVPTPTTPDRAFRPGDFASLCEALDEAARHPTGVNLHGARGELTEVLPYAALRAQSLEVAARLLAAGLRPGDRVALAAETTGEFLRAFFGCQYAGLTPAPAPLPAPFGGKGAYIEHIRRMLRSADASAAFAPGALGEWFVEAGEGLGLVAAGTLEALPPIQAPLSAPTVNPDGLCYLQFSSGSTRFPAGVAVTQSALMANVRGMGGPAGLQVAASDRTVSWLPLYHDMGLVGMLLTSLCFQLSIDLMPTTAFVRRPGLWLEAISRERATISYAPGFGYDLTARRGGAAREHPLDLSSWRVAGIGGDMIRPEPLRAFAQTFAPSGFDPRAFVASYGLAESTLALTLSPLGQGLRTDRVDLEALERRGIAERTGKGRVREFALCGRVLDGHQLEVRDEAGRVLEENQVGRIFAKGPSLMKNYFRMAEETQRAISPDGWLDTGDLGYRLDGQVVITGRAKDLIIVHGRNVWPQDLEWTAETEVAALRSGDVAVFSVFEEGTEKVVALVHCRTRDPEARAALSHSAAQAVRSRHGLDLQVVLAPPHSLPQTSSGKLSRAKAKALYLAGAFSSEAAPPVSA